MRINYKRTAQKEPTGMIPTKFKQTIDRKKRRLRDISPEAKVVAALTKCLAVQSKKDKINYYVAGEELYCPDVRVTEGGPTKRGKPPQRSYAAKGRFKMGRASDDGASFTTIQFDIRFRDSADKMGLPDLTIESADMTELGRGTPLKE